MPTSTSPSIGDAVAIDLSKAVTVDWETLGRVVGDQNSADQAAFLVGLAARLDTTRSANRLQIEFILDDLQRQGADALLIVKRVVEEMTVRIGEEL